MQCEQKRVYIGFSLPPSETLNVCMPVVSELYSYIDIRKTFKLSSTLFKENSKQNKPQYSPLDQ